MIFLPFFSFAAGFIFGEWGPSYFLLLFVAMWRSHPCISIRQVGRNIHYLHDAENQSCLWSLLPPTTRRRRRCMVTICAYPF
jgi:hypothetical protein